MNNNKYLTQMSTDIEEARAKATFPIQSMIYLLRGGKDAVERVQKTRELAEKEPLFNKSNMVFQSRQEVIQTLVYV